MRVKFACEPAGPVKILDSLPDAPLATLEGLNGIGKTLLVRMLQICTGTAPYVVGSAPWVSLCRGVGEFSMDIDGLVNERAISWRGDTRAWAKLEGPPDTRDFTAIRVDGRSSTIDEIRAILHVHRIAGDEGLVETLAQQAEVEASVVARVARQLTGTSGTPLSRLERYADEAKTELGQAGPDALARATSQLAKDEQRLEGLQAELSTAEERRAELDRAIELSQRLEKMASAAPELSQQLAEVDARIVTLQRQRDDAVAKLNHEAAKVAQATPWLAELRNAQRALDRNRNKLSEEVTAASTLAASLGLEPTPSAVKKRGDALGVEAELIAAQLEQLDAAPVMRSLLNDVDARLSTVEVAGLGDEVVWEQPSTGLSLTVVETRAGVNIRKSALEKVKSPPESEALRRRREAIAREISRLSVLEQHLTEAGRQQRLAEQNDVRFAEAVQHATPALAAEFGQLEERRKEYDGALLVAAADRARLRQQLGEAGTDESRAAIREQLDQLLTRLGVPYDQLLESHQQVVALERELAGMRAQADSQRRQSRAHLASAEADVRRTWQRLWDEQRLEWFRRGLENEVRASAPPIEVAASEIEAARRRLDSLVDRLGSFRFQMQATEQALRAIATHLRGAEPQATEYVTELEGALSRRFSQWFDNERVRQELLPGAEGTIEVDIHRRDVTWIVDGHQLSRPLQAFSSGEQAFAYTRAQLSLLDDESPRPENRLIVLDEFGAFIAFDRLDVLIEYLRDRRPDHPADQVLVILPLSRDYAKLAESAIGDDAQEYARMAEEVRTRKFTVEVLSR
jgi:uncharacterized coiled-coil DUF342 family protein